MREEIYRWMENLAVFYILFTAVLHLIPDNKYERYVRSFMGLLLILMLCTPVFSLLGKGGQLMGNFQLHYNTENQSLMEMEAENLQEVYLQQSYEAELEQKIKRSIQETGINIYGVTVHIEGERAEVLIYTEEELSEQQERGMEDALWSACGIRREDYRVQAAGTESAPVGGSPAGGDASGSDSNAGIGE